VGSEIHDSEELIGVTPISSSLYQHSRIYLLIYNKKKLKNIGALQKSKMCGKTRSRVSGSYPSSALAAETIITRLLWFLLIALLCFALIIK